MKIAYVDSHGISKTNLIKLDIVNKIIDEYLKDGLNLTLRQLYYQLVSRDIIPNQNKEYAKLSTLLTKGRMAGLVDWNAIEDRVRVPRIPYCVDDMIEALTNALNLYRLDRMRNQDVYIEVWVEKDALSGVLSRITRYYHINLMVNRGYSSTTAMYDAADRFRDEENSGRDCYILYLGDHDPSGLDMVRDIGDRLKAFGVFPEILPIALTHEQIEKYNPPPNPAKVTDPRAEGYVSRFGKVSWEVDALNPRTLNDILTNSIEGLIDLDRFEVILAKEESDSEKLKEFIDGFEYEEEI